MATGPLTGVVNQIRRLVVPASPDEQSDSALLQRFVSRQDQSAFAVLLQRHGPLVMRVCRQVLQNSADADDAFQATFLVLARQAGSIRQGESLPGWLYRVAYHIAVQARGRSVNRLVHEKQVAAMRPQAEQLIQPEVEEVWPILHDEVSRLPAKYRTPVVLCYLDGMTNEEAADHLQCPVGTVKTRLNRARDMLRDRLARRGVALTPMLLAGLFTQPQVASAIPAALSQATLHAVSLVSAGKSAAIAGVSTKVSGLAEHAVESLFFSKLKTMTAALVGLAVTGSGAGLWWQHTQATPETRPVAAHARLYGELPPRPELWANPPDLPAVNPAGDADLMHNRGFQASTTVYPKTDAADRGVKPAASSSREDARNQDAPPSRDDLYQFFLEEQKREKARQAALQLAEPPPPRPEPTKHDRTISTQGWWEWLWLPW